MRALTFQRVAERSSVSRATMYRRWESPAHLAVDVIRDRAATEITLRDTGSLTGDLRHVLRQIASFVASPIGRAAISASLEIGQSGGSSTADAGWPDRWTAIRPIFERAHARGEIGDLDGEAWFAAIAGALYFRLAVIGVAPDDTWIERILEAFRPS